MADKETIDNTKSYPQKIKLIQKPILNYTLSRVYNPSNAKDIAQDTLIILAKKESEFDSNKSFYNWAFNICNFQIKSYLLNVKRQKIRIDSYTNTHKAISDQSSPCPVTLINKQEKSNEELEKIEFIKRHLSPKQKIAFGYFLKGLSRKKIRGLMNMKKVALNATYRRIIQNAKKFLIMKKQYEKKKLK